MMESLDPVVVAGAEPVAGGREAQGCQGTLDARGACWRAARVACGAGCGHVELCPARSLLAQEDAEVIRLVTLYGAKKWSAIAEYLPGRIGKQCRER